MKERIRELAEQAWDTTAVSPDFGHPVSFAEKFAELIVRECADIASINQYQPYSAGHYVKKHFGFEE